MDTAFVIVADQRDSRHGQDRVPEALDRLATVRTRLPFERTAGDEIQALVATPESVVAAVVALTRAGGWRIGIGLGSVVEPLPSSTRAARGSAYLAARDAVVTSRATPAALALRTVGADGYGADEVQDAQTALWLLRSVLERRTEEGWQIVELRDQGLTGAESAARLRISESAASQRLKRSAHEEARAGALLAARLLARAAAR